MTNLTLIVDNFANTSHKIVGNLKFHDGKPVSMFCAIRGISDTAEGVRCLQMLVSQGLVERQENTLNHIVLYRYRAELNLLRREYVLKSV